MNKTIHTNTENFLINRPAAIDPSALEKQCRGFIAACIALAWTDAVGQSLGTHLKKMNDSWQKSAIEWIGSEQYKRWMNYLDLDPDMDPCGLMDEYGDLINEFWESGDENEL